MAVDYVAKISRADTAELSRMLDALAEGRRLQGWAGGKAFEHIILRAFALEGAEVRWPFEVREGRHAIEQIDGAVYCDGLFCLVESKDYAEAINVEPVAKLRNQLARRPAGTLGLIFARSGFTPSAKYLVKMHTPLNILLWEFEELKLAIADQKMRSALQTKFRYAVEQALPDYNIERGYR